MLTIKSKLLAPTDTKGTRIKASCNRGSIIVGYDHALDLEGNHVAAAKALQAKLGIVAILRTGQVDLDFFHVDVSDMATAVFETRRAMARGENNGNPHARMWGQKVCNITDRSNDGSLAAEYEAFLDGFHKEHSV